MNTKHMTDPKCHTKKLRGLANMKKTRLVSNLSLSISGALLMGVASTEVAAIEFGKNKFRGSWDTTLTYGASIRLEERDPDLVGKVNLDPFVGLLDPQARVNAPGRFSVNSDDGNLNYDDGDFISNAVKATSELGFSYGNFGGFVRATYFYDFENENNDFLSDRAKEAVGSDFRLLDAYVYYDFSIGDNSGTVRFGKQVVSWGESTFIQGGINVINPIDVSKLRVAGAELKEAFLPINMIWGSLDITQNLSIEGMYMLDYRETAPDPIGTYFSTNDFATPGSEFVMLGFGLSDEGTLTTTVPRLANKQVDDSGEFGIAFRYFSQALNDTEFAFYYLNYTSRLPLLSGVAVSNSCPCSAGYFVEYPEDIDMYGFSFNTTLPFGIAWQGEVSYRPNQPLLIDDVELLFAALSPLNSAIPVPALRFDSQLGQFQVGDVIKGYEEHEVSQMQFTFTKLVGPNNFVQANQVVLLAEVAINKVWDLPNLNNLRYNGPGTDTGGGADIFTGAFRNPLTETGNFATSSSWGYRLVTRLDYNSAFGTAFNVSPRLAFAHDVNGTTPGPGGSFVEDRKSLTAGIAIDYLQKWSGDLSYTRFFGAGIANLISDRDFAAFNVKYSF